MMNFNPTFSDNNNKIDVKLNTSNQSVNVGSQNYTMAKNYELLTNKPSINEVELIGNKTSEELHLQDELISGQNIKTINDESLLGSGNITINPSDIFWCNPNLTTYMDVNEALQNGKIPVVKYYDSTYGEIILYYTCSDTDEYYDSFYKFSTTKDSKIFTVSVTGDNWSALSIYETKDITVILYGSQDSLLWINLDLSKPVVLMTALTHECFHISNYDDLSENATFVYIDDSGVLHVASVDWSEHTTVSYSISTIALQEKLISGNNIKTINNTSILGSGNISITPSQIFWCAKDSTTYMEVNQALQNGKIPVVKYYNNTYGDVILIYACSDVDEYSNGIYKFSTSKDSKIFTVSLNSYDDTWSSLSVYETKDLNIISYNSQDSLLWMNLNLGKPTVVIKSSTNEFFNLVNYDDSTEKATCVYIDGNKTLHLLLVDWSDHSSVDYTITTQNLQDELISGTNIKTINNTSLLGSGDIDTTQLAEVTYGTTTYSEIDTIVSNGKIPYVSYSDGNIDGIYLFVGSESGTHYFEMVRDSQAFRLDCDYGDNWHYQSIGLETTSYKVSSWQSTPDDTHYPSEKLVKDTIDAKQDTLVSGTNIKSINSNSLLGSGNLDIHEIPAGGNAGQVLSKSSATDYDVHWTNQTVTYPSGYCTTSGSNQKKVINCTLWTATANTYLHILIGQANTYAGEIRFNVNSTGDVPVYINGTISSATNYSLPAGTYIVFYDGTYFYLRTDGVIPNTQEVLVSGTNIKTINSTTLLGSGNIDTVELYECTYGTTTYNQVSQAITDGKLPYVKKDSYILFASNLTASYCRFGGSYSITNYYANLTSADVWSSGYKGLESTSNKVTSLSVSSTDTEYPSAKCVYDAIQNAGGSSLVTETVTLLANAWASSGSGYTQSVTTTNDPDSKNTVWVSPKTDGGIDYMSDYTSNGIYCKSSGSLSLTFYASSIPSQDIVVNVTMG